MILIAVRTALFATILAGGFAQALPAQAQTAIGVSYQLGASTVTRRTDMLPKAWRHRTRAADKPFARAVSIR